MTEKERKTAQKRMMGTPDEIEIIEEDKKKDLKEKEQEEEKTFSEKKK